MTPSNQGDNSLSKTPNVLLSRLGYLLIINSYFMHLPYSLLYVLILGLRPFILVETKI